MYKFPKCYQKDYRSTIKSKVEKYLRDDWRTIAGLWWEGQNCACETCDSHRKIGIIGDTGERICQKCFDE